MVASCSCEPAAQSGKVRDKKRVLVVDDDASIRMLLELGLRLWGFESRVAENGIAAQRFVQNDHFDVILVDLMMPLMDGLSFIEWLRQTAQVKTPVLVLTSVQNPKVAQEALALGANGVAHKPIHMDQILEELAKLVPG